MGYLLGLDVSTTGVKALVIDDDGLVVGSATTDLPLSTPKPLWSEQNPEDWWDGSINSIRVVLEKTNINGADITAIGLTGQMHGLTMLDSEGTVIRPAILWNDQRTGTQCDAIRELVGKQELINITGNNALTGFTAPKILWVRENEPSNYNRCNHILLPKDYVRYKLTDEFATDKADGSGTILMNIKTRDWSSKVLDKLGIPIGWMPKTFEGTEVTGTITEKAASLTGLIVGTPVVGGGGDQAAQAVGVGAVEPGVAALTLGTSGVIFATTQEPFIEPNGLLHSFCHSVPGRWHMMGVMLSAAGSLRWYRETFAPHLDYDELLAPAADIQPGCEGLLFQPYLTGERTPHPDPLARGGFIGITIRHTMPHHTRAVLEGVAFGLRDCFELIKSAGLGKIQQVRISGGGARSKLWTQIIADVLNSELVTINTTEGAAYGAALLAGVGGKIWSSVDEATKATIQLTGKTKPVSNTVNIYEQYYAVYQKLYPTLKGLAHQLSRL